MDGFTWQFIWRIASGYIIIVTKFVLDIVPYILLTLDIEKYNFTRRIGAAACPYLAYSG